MLNLDAEDATGVLHELTASISSARIGVESAWRLGALEPFAELGARYDGGDGETGAGVELAGGVRLREDMAGVGLEAKGRWLAVHSAAGFSEGGFSLIASVAPGARGQGLRLRLAPRWGAPTDRVALAGAGDRSGRSHAAAGRGLGRGHEHRLRLCPPRGARARHAFRGVGPDRGWRATDSPRRSLPHRARVGLRRPGLRSSGEHIRDERRFAGDRGRIVVTARGAL